MNGRYKMTANAFLLYIDCFERNKIFKNVKFDKKQIYIQYQVLANL